MSIDRELNQVKNKSLTNEIMNYDLYNSKLNRFKEIHEHIKLKHKHKL